MLTLFVIISAVAYTLTRFVVIDALFDNPRDRVHGWLIGKKKPWSLKLSEGLGCTACMSWWFSLLVVLGMDLPPWWDVSVPLPVLMVPACRTGALVFAIIIDPVEDDEDE